MSKTPNRSDRPTIGLLVDAIYDGFQDGVWTHLVEFHGYRRIAFIRGPKVSTDAEARFRAYRESLERYGIPYDPARVFMGDFGRQSGLEAIAAFTMVFGTSS